MKILRKNKDKKPHPSKIKGHGAEGERIVRSRLTRLNFEEDNAKLINDLIIVDDKGNSHQIDHILIRHNGVFVIETKNWSGLVIGKEDDECWTIILNRKRYSSLNPVIQNRNHCKHVNAIIGDNYRVNSLIVMMQNNGKKLGIPDVINGCSLRRYIREYDDGTILSNEDIEIIHNRLMDASSDMTLDEHIRNTH